MNQYVIGITLKEFEVLADVLSEIEEYREYEDDTVHLRSLQEKFSYAKYMEFRDGGK